MSESIPVTETLNLLPEVTWDRFIEGEGHVTAYGWVERDGKCPDFVLVSLDCDGPWYFATSSAKYSEDFHRRLGFKQSSEGHKPCQRVEDRFPNVKSIKLKS